MMSEQVVIVGGGQAGTRRKRCAHRAGAGRSPLLSKEEHLPYERPPVFMWQQLQPDLVALRETRNLKSILQPAVH